jgi:hypothetical protein
MEEIKLSEFSIKLGEAVDNYVSTAIARIVFLENKIIEYYKLTNDEKYKEFFEIQFNETPIEEPVNDIVKEPKKKSKMRIVK